MGRDPSADRSGVDSRCSCARSADAHGSAVAVGVVARAAHIGVGCYLAAGVGTGGGGARRSRVPSRRRCPGNDGARDVVGKERVVVAECPCRRSVAPVGASLFEVAADPRKFRRQPRVSLEWAAVCGVRPGDVGGVSRCSVALEACLAAHAAYPGDADHQEVPEPTPTGNCLGAGSQPDRERDRVEPRQARVLGTHRGWLRHGLVVVARTVGEETDGYLESWS